MDAETLDRLARIREYLEGSDTTHIYAESEWCGQQTDEILGEIMGMVNEILDPEPLLPEWTDTTWDRVVCGDEVLGADDEVWTVRSALSLRNANSVVVERGEQTFTFRPAPDQPVKARRGDTGSAMDTLTTAFSVNVLSNGDAR